MKIGSQLESSMWVDGTETDEQMQTHRVHIAGQIALLAYEHGWEAGPITFQEKKPGEERVPQVPDHIQGPNVRLIVAEAEIIGKRVETSPASFVANLDRKDLARLRHITRNAHAQYNKGGLTDLECDEIIEEIGPESAIATLKQTVTLH